MHNVKPVPRDSHHVPAQGSEEDGTTAATICCITATESSLSVVTEAPTVPTTTTADAAADTAESPSSHSASWVGRKVDALFSPVLSFLNGASGGEEEEGDGGGGGEPLAADGGEGASSKADLTSFLAKETSDGDKNESEEEEEVQKMVREALLQVSESYTLCSCFTLLYAHQYYCILLFLIQSNFEPDSNSLPPKGQN